MFSLAFTFRCAILTVAGPGVDVKASRVPKIDDHVLASFVTFTMRPTS